MDSMYEKKLINLLSMAQRAGKVLSGDFVVTEAMGKKKCPVKLLIVAEDASSETLKKFQSLAQERNVDMRCALTKDSLGHCIGKEYRAMAAVTDTGFAKAMIKLLEDEGGILRG